MAILPFLLVIVPNLLFSPVLSSEINTVTEFEPLHDGTTLVSQPGGTFELGFFTPGSSTNCYVGIWFKNIPSKTVVWIANRDNPINQNSSKLSITKDGNLVLLSKNGTIHWSTNAKPNGSNSNAIIVANLLDTGNLVLRDERDNISQNYLWQSFDYPTDTLLPKMKLRWNQISGLNKPLISWKNWDNPSSAMNFTYPIKPGNNPEMAIWNGLSILYRSGPWNGIRFSGMLSSTYIDFEVENGEYYLIFTPRYESTLSRIVINQTARALQSFEWNEENRNWDKFKTEPLDICDDYNLCGPFGNCDISDSDSSPISVCKCLNGFKPYSPQNLSQGCVRSGNWRCKDVEKDGFMKVSNMKIPDDSGNSWVNRSMKVEECRDRCWENCSCTAYAKTDVTEDGNGCIVWFGDLKDLRKVKDAGQDLFVRLDPSELDTKDDDQKIVVVVHIRLPEEKNQISRDYQENSEEKCTHTRRFGTTFL